MNKAKSCRLLHGESRPTILFELSYPDFRTMAFGESNCRSAMDLMHEHGKEERVSKTMGMDAKQLEAFCGSWPGVTRDIKWENNLVLSVGGKMFAMTPCDGSGGGRLSFKVEDDRFLELTDRPGIIPAPYLARARWISITEPGRFRAAELQAFIHQAYALIRGRLTKKMQAELAPQPILKVEKK